MVCVKEILMRYADLLKEIKEILPQIKKESILGKKVEKIQKHMIILTKDKEAKVHLKLQLFEDYKKGYLDEADYKEMSQTCTKQIKENDEQMERLERQIQELEQKDQLDMGWIEDILKFEDKKELERQYLVTVIKQIHVFPDGKLKIELRNKNEISELLEWVADNTEIHIESDDNEERGVHLYG